MKLLESSWGQNKELIHFGGEKTVTGSCHLLRVNGVNILVDCGLAQGGDRVLPMAEWPVEPEKIDFLFLTHAHIDHIGRLPEIMRGGFRGEIITTEATAFLLRPMLRDALGFSDGCLCVKPYKLPYENIDECSCVWYIKK
jgi:metallo-beta-lactamase family protein